MEGSGESKAFLLEVEAPLPPPCDFLKGPVNLSGMFSDVLPPPLLCERPAVSGWAQRPGDAPQLPSEATQQPQGSYAYGSAIKQDGLRPGVQPVPGSGRWAEDSLELGWKLWLWACWPGRSNLLGGCQSERFSRRGLGLCWPAVRKGSWWHWFFYMLSPSLSLWPSRPLLMALVVARSL